MKVDVFTAPLSEEGQELLRDPSAAQELLYKLLADGSRDRFEVKAGARTFDVSSSAPVATAPPPRTR
jgi:hypothetical protein